MKRPSLQGVVLCLLLAGISPQASLAGDITLFTGVQNPGKLTYNNVVRDTKLGGVFGARFSQGQVIGFETAEMRAEVAALAAAGRSYDEIINYYVEKYGSQEPLASPIDKGFNRLAWLLPYALGAAGVVVIGGVALRWSRRGSVVAADETPVAPANAALESRLDDELRDLD